MKMRVVIWPQKGTKSFLDADSFDALRLLRTGNAGYAVFLATKTQRHKKYLVPWWLSGKGSLPLKLIRRGQKGFA
jgi:hypothetical protein